jgi:hypothetical protein
LENIREAPNLIPPFDINAHTEVAFAYFESPFFEGFDSSYHDAREPVNGYEAEAIDDNGNNEGDRKVVTDSRFNLVKVIDHDDIPEKAKLFPVVAERGKSLEDLFVGGFDGANIPFVEGALEIAEGACYPGFSDEPPIVTIEVVSFACEEGFVGFEEKVVETPLKNIVAGEI